MGPSVSLLLLLSVTGSSLAQELPVWTVITAKATSTRSFDQVRGAVELSDGRLIVLDDGLYVVNLRSELSVRIGRFGDGPGEYRAPLRLMALPGDTTGYLDMARPRQLPLILPSGELRGKLEFRVRENVSEPQGADRAGGIYAQQSRRGGAAASKDSSIIIRWNRRTERFDTVGQLRHAMVGHAPPRNTRPPPFFTFEQWAVNQDGRVAVVSVKPYRVTFFNPDRTVISGPVIDEEQVPLTGAHRQAWVEEAAKPVRALASYNGGPRTWTLVRRRPEDIRVSSWPRFLPPFLPDAVTYAPDGMLWVRRTTPDPSTATFDIIDQRGKRVGRIALPQGQRLLAHGRGGVYLVREDEDGLQYLSLYELPSAYLSAAGRAP